MKMKTLSVKQLFGWVATELVISMTVITIVLFFVTKQTVVLRLAGRCCCAPLSGFLY